VYALPLVTVIAMTLSPDMDGSALCGSNVNVVKGGIVHRILRAILPTGWRLL